MQKHHKEQISDISNYTSQAIKVCLGLFYEATERNNLHFRRVVKKKKEQFVIEQGELSKEKELKRGTFSQCLKFIIDLDRPVRKIKKENKKASRKK